MPVSRDSTNRMADRSARVWRDAERRLIQLVADMLQRDSEQHRLQGARMRLFRRRAAAIVADVLEDGKLEGAQAIRAAVRIGEDAADVDVLALGGAVADEHVGQPRAIAALIAEYEGQLDKLGPQILRTATDAYRTATAAAVTGALSGQTTRLQDAQHVIDTLARKGIASYVDNAGRRWSMSTYAEMATRTATVRASVAGHLDRLTRSGFDLVRVSDSPRECEQCRPWEGKVLSTSTTTGTVWRSSYTTGELVRVDVDGTVAEATSDGLFHPNCTHTLGAYLPGVTSQRPQAAENPEGYARRQQLRAAERKIREWKLREAGALTPDARRRASAKVREWQGRIRDLLDDDTGLMRQRHREQINRAR